MVNDNFLGYLDIAGFLVFLIFCLHGVLFNGICTVPTTGLLNLSSRLMAQSQLPSMQNNLSFRVCILLGAQKVSEH